MRVPLVLGVLCTFLTSSHAQVPDPGPGFTWRLTQVEGTGNPDQDPSVFEPDLSRLGLHGCFHSRAINLAPGADDGTDQVYYFDTIAGAESVRLVSVNAFGEPGDGDSFDAVISKGKDADGYKGRYVAFASAATNLVDDDTNGIPDVFVFDRIEGDLARVSVDSSGNPGTYEGEHEAVCHADVTISDDGRFVGFVSLATLHPDDTNAFADIYLHDRDHDEDGVFDEQSEPGAIRTWIVSLNERGESLNGHCGRPTLAGLGEKMAWVTWATNVLPDSMPPDDNGGIDGICTDVGHLRRTDEHRMALITQAMDGGWQNIGGCTPSVSRDGRFVSFTSHSTNLAVDTGPITDPPPLADHVPLKAFVRDMWKAEPGKILHLSRNRYDGGPPDDNCFRTVLSTNGCKMFVTFGSIATDLHADDVDPTCDVYVARIECDGYGGVRLHGVHLLSRFFPTGSKSDAPSSDSEVVNKGNVVGVAFASRAANWGGEGTSGYADLYFSGKRVY